MTSTVNNNSSGSGLSSDVLAMLNKKTSTTNDTSSNNSPTDKTTLGQDSFMKLLVTQLKNQNPLNPQDNTAFVAQLAQFSSLQGIQNLNTTVNSLASSMQSSQALQASALVGRTVEVESTTAYLPKDGYVRGTIALQDSTSSLQLNIYDSNKKLVLQKDLGTQEAGDLPFAWDGTNSAGATVDPGTYRFEVLAKGVDGKSKAVTTYLGHNVDSVTVGANQQVTLNVDGVGQVALSDVKNIL
jgi:flagellar basal-body rod modification protein FlgD